MFRQDHANLSLLQNELARPRLIGCRERKLVVVERELCLFLVKYIRQRIRCFGKLVLVKEGNGAILVWA